MSMSPNFTPFFYMVFGFSICFSQQTSGFAPQVGCLQKQGAQQLQLNTTQQTPRTTRTTRDDFHRVFQAAKEPQFAKVLMGEGLFPVWVGDFGYFSQEGWDTHPV